jgi:two-component system OmpR family sensor kinase
MSLRTRLLIAVGGLLVVALVVSGILVVGITRQNLVDQLDTDLRNASGNDLGLSGPGNGPADITGRRYALLAFDADGDQLAALPSGPGYQPDSLPQLPTGGAQTLALGHIVELPAEDGSLRYRVLKEFASIRGIPIRVTAVLAAPMSGVESSIGVLVRTLIIVGVLVLAAAVIVGWLMIRSNLRPLERMTATAARISAGDLSQRVGIGEPSTEVGRLGQAFDSMLDQIQGAFQDQQRALTAKERSEGKLRQFVADASHELRTPLTAVRGYADLYRAGGLDDEATLEQAMMRIGTESRRMTELVEDMLLLARLDQGRPLAREPVSMTDLVGDAVNDARAIEPARPINAKVDDNVTVLGDEDRLRQVVGNLFANVRVHTPPETPIDVALSAVDGRCTFVVADHGPGVEPAHVGHIFDRFYRADPARSRDRGGSGLGLAIAAGVVEAHGGTITYAHTADGGATFTVDLPRNSTAHPTEA